MHDDGRDRLDTGGPDDETRSLVDLARHEASRATLEDPTRQLDDPELGASDYDYDYGDMRGSTSLSRSYDDDLSEDSLVGERIGRFSVLGILGRGGMGTVYDAFDQTLGRNVAVKVLHRDVAPAHQDRLIAEAQALARLSHPNVVQVYEAGRAGDRAFVAMELVQGQTLRRWIKQQPRPGWKACVEVYMQAGAGLAAAHEQGMVHCDFKPSNAIVDDKGRVRVLDFGLARMAIDMDSQSSAAERARRRRKRSSSDDGLAAVMGTPAYMPLEQMQGHEIDARGDQFSFCVALYEAVYAERPFVGRTLDELKAEREAERIVAPPRNTKVPGELREILLRGLATDPEQRWPTMQALLDRLRPLITPRGRRTLLVVTGTLALSGTIAGAGLAYQAELAQRCSGARAQLEGIWDEGRRQQVEGAILGTGLSYAADTWERVSGSLDGYADAWVEMHTEVCEATSVRQEQTEATMDLRMACLRNHRVALREAVNVLAEAEATRVQQAVTLVGSLPPVARCEDVETLQSERAQPEDPQVAEQVAALREGLVLVRTQRSAGLYDQAAAEAEGIVARAETLGHAPLLAEALHEQGEVRHEQAAYDEAEQDLERSYLLAAQLEHAAVAAAAVRELAFVVGHDQARHEAGLQWSKTALALARRPRAEPQEEAEALSTVGAILLHKGELDEALENERHALEIFEAVPGSDPLGIADLLHNIGNVLLRQGKQEEALSHLRRALAIREEALGPHHPHVAQSLTTIGVVLVQQGKWEPALEQLRRALRIREEAVGPRHPDVAVTLNNIGAVLKQQGKMDEALDHFQRALEIQQEVLGANHPRVAYPLNNIGEVLREQDKIDEALDYLQRALEISREALGARHPDVASSMINLGNLLLRQGRYDEAEKLYRDALEIQQEALPPDHPHLALSLLGLAKIGIEREEHDVARQHAERAVAIREAGQMPPELVAEARFVLARALGNDPDQRARARELAEQARDAWSSAGSEDRQTKEYLGEVEKWLAGHPAP
ncbi:MAG: serine/threonine protein kinase [Myxococcales bacterium]|nr:serine/threonine protein kinase [Myxococcales bacterium]